MQRFVDTKLFADTKVSADTKLFVDTKVFAEDALLCQFVPHDRPVLVYSKMTCNYHYPPHREQTLLKETNHCKRSCQDLRVFFLGRQSLALYQLRGMGWGTVC